MLPWPTVKPYAILAAASAIAYAAYVAIVAYNQRSLIFFPTHDAQPSALTPWTVNGQIVGYCRAVENPRTIWLMMHGNGGQASHRAYVLQRMTEKDSLYVLEYPGYGLRGGIPARASFDRSAAEAFQLLRQEFPRAAIGVIGESIGSGPACSLAALPRPPEKIVLVVPFDMFASVAAEHMPLLPVRAILKDNWDNVAALKDYAGPVDIFGATDDQVISFAHAKNLAAHVRQSKMVAVPGGHNDWSGSDLVRIEL